MSPGQRGAGHRRREVREHRQHVRLGVPEHVPVIAVAGQPLGRDRPVAVRATRLDEVEHREPDRLLELPVAVEPHVGDLPGRVQAGPLVGQQGVEAVGAGGVRLGGDQVSHLVGGHPVDRRALVRGELRQPQPLTRVQPAGNCQPYPVRGAVACGGHRVRRVHQVADRHRHALPAALGAVHKHPVEARRAVRLGGQRVGEHLRRTRVVGAFRHPLVGQQVRADPQLGGAVQRLDLVADGGDRAARQRHQPDAAHQHPPPARRDPLRLPTQHARPQVKHPLVTAQRPRPQVQRLVVDPEPDQRGVRRAYRCVTGLRKRYPSSG